MHFRENFWHYHKSNGEILSSLAIPPPPKKNQTSGFACHFLSFSTFEWDGISCQRVISGVTFLPSTMVYSVVLIKKGHLLIIEGVIIFYTPIYTRHDVNQKSQSELNFFQDLIQIWNWYGHRYYYKLCIQICTGCCSSFPEIWIYQLHITT